MASSGWLYRGAAPVLQLGCSQRGRRSKQSSRDKDMLSARAQDYLETIYNVTMEGDAVVGVRLAAKFGVSPASVAEMLQRLARDGYITMGRATGAVLTDKGAAEA